MKVIHGIATTLLIGQPTVVDSNSPTTSFATVFEDEGDTGYFYALDTRLEEPILDALQIYNVATVSDGNVPSRLQIAWSPDGFKSALIINDYVHAVFDFESCRGYCRTGFPPITDWSNDGHGWNDEAIELFS
jgi:hypothetical protein